MEAVQLFIDLYTYVEVGARLAQSRHTLVRDLIAPNEIQRGELGAPLGQRDHTLVRDLIARLEIQRGEPREHARNQNQIRISQSPTT